MDFRGSKSSIIIRVVALTATIFVLAFLAYNDGFAINQLIVLGLVGLQVFSLIRHLDRSNREIITFLNSIEYDDLSYSYKATGSNSSVDKLNQELNKVLERLRDIRKDKEADFQYLKNIVQHVGIGLITFDKNGTIQIMNTAAKKLLKIDQIENVDELKTLSEPLVEIFSRLMTGGRDLVRLEVGGEIVQLAVYAIELTLRGEEYKLVSLQNIQSELEEKEMEAWQNLVRVLTHEIMNSVTPISSLATTVEQELRHQLEGTEDYSFSDEEVGDIHLAIQTIQKRSKGLIRFVQDFRNLTHIPKPKLSVINIQQLFSELCVLLKKEIEANNIQLKVNVEPSNLSINADKELIEQVLINLVKNATQAFDEQTLRLIELTAYYGDKGRPIISVKDNGSGIEEEALDKIFIPFFTTKKSGSGIGLSLSRQIMRQHQGTLGVKSKIDEGTEFFLKF
ncbi:MAG: ATP-binding protein [Bacteroidota bacterium]